MAKKRTTKKTTRKAPARKTGARKTTARKTTARKTTARKTTARKTSARKKTAKKATTRTATGPKAIRGQAETRTKSQMLNTLAEACDIPRKEVSHVLGALEQMVVADLKKGGKVKLMGMKMELVKKPATKARKGVNPFTGETMMFKAKPASKRVKVRALKTLNQNF